MRKSALFLGAVLALLACVAAKAAPLDPYAGVSLGGGIGSVNADGQNIKPSGFIGSIKAGVDYNLTDRFAIGPVVEYFPDQSLFGSQSFGCGNDCYVTTGGVRHGHMSGDESLPTEQDFVVGTPSTKTILVPNGGTTQVHLKAGAIAYGFRGGVRFGANKSWMLSALGGWNRATGEVKVSGYSPYLKTQNKFEASGNGHYVGFGLEKKVSNHWTVGIEGVRTEITFKEYGITEKVNVGTATLTYHF